MFEFLWRVVIFFWEQNSTLNCEQHFDLSRIPQNIPFTGGIHTEDNLAKDVSVLSLWESYPLRVIIPFLWIAWKWAWITGSLMEGVANFRGSRKNSGVENARWKKRKEIYCVESFENLPQKGPFVDKEHTNFSFSHIKSIFPITFFFTIISHEETTWRRKYENPIFRWEPLRHYWMRGVFGIYVWKIT